MARMMAWPEGHDPDTSVNFVSEELDVPVLSAVSIWPHIIDTSKWESYYGYMSSVVFPDGSGPLLSLGARFCLFALTYPVQAEVTEFQPPSDSAPGRLAWRGRVEENGKRLDLYHVWLIEDRPREGALILTQETQHGELAKEIAAAEPSPMLYSHQDWVKSLAAAALRAQTNQEYPGGI